MLAILVCGCTSVERPQIETYPLASVTVGGPLQQRLLRNLERLESETYQPQNEFNEDTWPGDFVGRTILGVTMNAQASHQTPQYLDQIVKELPSHLNAKGYLGPDYGTKINEQQLSGHGWLLRGLCEYSRCTGDQAVVPIIRSIVDSLFLPGTEKYPLYPIDSLERTNAGGGASGSIVSDDSDWMLSTDIGCIFIGMSGLIDAYEFLGQPEDMKPAIENLLSRFLDVNLVAIQAQTHATLTALRGLLKYYKLTGDRKWLAEASLRWNLYVDEGMTANYENRNWFGRNDWTEPCAIVDSYMVAFELWKETQDPVYRDMAELIYYNAICHTQRDNGGFGCDNVPSAEDPFLYVKTPEAYWCCTMRGGEGLARIAESTWAHSGNSLYAVFFRESSINDESLSVTETTGYPFDTTVTITFNRNDAGISSLLFPILPWGENFSISLNGTTEGLASVIEPNGFVRIDRKFVAGDVVRIAFSLMDTQDEWDGMKRFSHGPFILADSLQTPIYHQMSQSVLDPLYKRRILF